MTLIGKLYKTKKVVVTSNEAGNLVYVNENIIILITKITKLLMNKENDERFDKYKIQFFCDKQILNVTFKGDIEICTIYSWLTYNLQEI